jgi:gamma-glutamyltranspeptidase/glutathione hydrolase
MYVNGKVIAEKRLGIPATQTEYLSSEVGIVQAMKRKGNEFIAVADPRSEGVALPVH